MHKIKVFYNEIDGANKKVQQALILVWLTELNKVKIGKNTKKKTVFQKITIFQSGVWRQDKIKIILILLKWDENPLILKVSSTIEA